MKSEVADHALFVSLDNDSSEPVVGWFLPNFDLVFFSWEDMTDEPYVVDLQQVGIFLQNVLDDGSCTDSIATKSMKNRLRESLNRGNVWVDM